MTLPDNLILEYQVEIAKHFPCKWGDNWLGFYEQFNNIDASIFIIE